MSPTKLQRVAKNGSGAGTNGVRKRSRAVPGGSPDVRLSPDAQELARLAPVEAQPVDAPMWPTHPVVWLQPALRPALPSSSGLSIERHLRIPAPDFINPGITAASIAQTLNAERDPLAPDLARPLPKSGLQPLGWDPREHCRKEGDR